MAIEKQRRAFISYSHVNRDFAIKLAKALRAAEYAVWFDQLDIPAGARWDDEVENALRDCSIFMVILTPASIASENVKDEIGYAIDHGKRILPVLLEDCDVPLRLRRFQYVDFTAKSFEQGLESAKELLGGLVDEASEPIAVKPLAVENVSKSKPVSNASAQKKPMSRSMIIGIIVVVVIVLAIIIGIWLTSGDNSSGDSTPSPLDTPSSYSINNVQALEVDFLNNPQNRLDYEWVSYDSTKKHIAIDADTLLYKNNSESTDSELFL
ncbi:MAG: toll/interleukin-1 receptor domain-containing protein [Anaerolineales bacterium]